MRGDVVVYIRNQIGHPSNRSIRQGFWQWPIRVIDSTGLVVGEIRPAEAGWPHCEADGPVRVVQAWTEPGMHGGWVVLRVVVPDGARLQHAVPGS